MTQSNPKTSSHRKRRKQRRNQTPRTELYKKITFLEDMIDALETNMALHESIETSLRAKIHEMDRICKALGFPIDKPLEEMDVMRLK